MYIFILLGNHSFENSFSLSQERITSMSFHIEGIYRVYPRLHSSTSDPDMPYHLHEYQLQPDQILLHVQLKLFQYHLISICIEMYGVVHIDMRHSHICFSSVSGTASFKTFFIISICLILCQCESCQERN